MRRVGSIREVADISLELPAGANPYEDFDFEPYFEEARHEEELRKTWRVFTKVKDVLDNGRRLENASWRLWFKERRNTTNSISFSSPSQTPDSVPTSTPVFAPSSAPSSAPAPAPAPAPEPAPAPALAPAPEISATATTTTTISTTSESAPESTTKPPLPSTPQEPLSASAPSAPMDNLISMNVLPPQSSFMPPAQTNEQDVSPSIPIPPVVKPPRPVLSDSSLSSLERYDLTLDANLRKAEEETDRIVGDMFGGVGQRFQAETLKNLERAKVERTKALLNIAERYSLSDQVVDEILQWAHSYIIPSDSNGSGIPGPTLPADDLSFIGSVQEEPSSNTDIDSSGSSPVFNSSPLLMGDENDPQLINELLPLDCKSAKSYLSQTKYRPRPRVAAFSHSLERNGANNFLLYLIRELRNDMSFTLISPKDGPMHADYESLGVHVVICKMKSRNYKTDLRLLLPNFEYAIANTIMTMEVIHACNDLNVPCLWIIHEAWPKDQFDYYAKEVFMMSSIDSTGIISAFKKAHNIVFPANVQYRCYHGLFNPANAKVIYNGIPLASINAFRATQVRKQVRADLGYTKNDFIILHMGSICKRKGQLLTCEAFGELRSMFPGKMKLLMVGARHIRRHEIDYTDECRATLEGDDSLKDTVILDVKKNVLPYYLAADVVVCPSLNEVLPLVLCEAMAFEKPVIASRIDGIPEAIKDGVEGILIEAGNVAQLVEAVEELVVDEAKRKRMGAAGRKRVLKQFSFESMSKTYRETIGEDLKLDLTIGR